MGLLPDDVDFDSPWKDPSDDIPPLKKRIAELEQENERLQTLLKESEIDRNTCWKMKRKCKEHWLERAAEIVRNTVVGVDENGLYNDPLKEAEKAIRAELEK